LREEKDVEKKRQNRYLRYLISLFCIPTIAFMFLKWVRISAFNEIKSNFSLFKSLKSDYSLLEVFKFFDKYGQYVNEKYNTEIITVVGVVAVVAIAATALLFVALLFGTKRHVRTAAMASFASCAGLFFLFVAVADYINDTIIEISSGRLGQIFEPTIIPYLMFISAACLFGMSFLLVRE
jgi:hypothetical protein